MIDKKTVFVLGAGASCPYGYPSGARLRERICLPQGFWGSYNASGIEFPQKEKRLEDLKKFIDVFNKSKIKSIDLFMANNPYFAQIGKYIISFEILRAEGTSHFSEEAKLEREHIAYLQSQGKRRPLEFLAGSLVVGEDWYFYLYNRLIEGRVGKDALPDFSNDNVAFITFNYDRSLEQFFYEALRYSFTEVPEERIIQSLKQLKILHVYGQIAPLKWQNPNDYIDYKRPIDESLLQRGAKNIITIHDEKQNDELTEAQNLLKQAERIFFLGFGYAPENMKVLNLPDVIHLFCREVFGTAFGAENKEIEDIRNRVGLRRKSSILADNNSDWVKIENMDCLKLLRNYL